MTTVITVPLGVAFALGLDRWHGRLPTGWNFAMLMSFVVPEIILGVSLFFVASSLNTPLQAGTTGQVLGLVTFQLSYPVVIVRARLGKLSGNGRRKVAEQRPVVRRLQPMNPHSAEKATANLERP